MWIRSSDSRFERVLGLRPRRSDCARWRRPTSSTPSCSPTAGVGVGAADELRQRGLILRDGEPAGPRERVRRPTYGPAMVVLATWTDVGIFIATAAGVVVTLAAVLVALFGPGWDRRRRRPAITINPSWRWLSTNIGGSDRIRLILRNKPGCDTAHDVEVFAYVTRSMNGGFGATADQANLNFDDPEQEGPGRSTASVPPGFGREVNLAVLVEPDQDRHPRSVSYLALYPTRLAKEARLLAAETYEVSIVATGSNFDAVSYVGHLSFGPLDDEDGDIVVRWVDFVPSTMAAFEPRAT
jgi:hypothetical protein